METWSKDGVEKSLLGLPQSPSAGAISLAPLAVIHLPLSPAMFCPHHIFMHSTLQDQLCIRHYSGHRDSRMPETQSLTTRSSQKSKCTNSPTVKTGRQEPSGSTGLHRVYPQRGGGRKQTGTMEVGREVLLAEGLPCAQVERCRKHSSAEAQ